MAHRIGGPARSPALMRRLAANDTRPRVVLDTNAWLDLLHYRDPRGQALADALAAGEVVAVTHDACRAEWQRVLGYRQLKLDAGARQFLDAAHDACAHVWTDDRAPPVDLTRLPRCADPDDQKFIELAAACGARWLVSRDLAVLALGRRTAEARLFWILTPEQWGVAHAPA